MYHLSFNARPAFVKRQSITTPPDRTDCKPRRFRSYPHFPLFIVARPRCPLFSAFTGRSFEPKVPPKRSKPVRASFRNLRSRRNGSNLSCRPRASVPRQPPLKSDAYSQPIHPAPITADLGIRSFAETCRSVVERCISSNAISPDGVIRSGGNQNHSDAQPAAFLRLS